MERGLGVSARSQQLRHLHAAQQSQPNVLHETPPSQHHLGTSALLRSLTKQRPHSENRGQWHCDGTESTGELDSRDVVVSRPPSS